MPVPRRRRIVEVLAVVAGGSWGAVGGAMCFAVLAAAAGAPTGTGTGEFFPGPGWNRFTAFMIGLPVGFALGATAALRAVRHRPRLLGVPIAAIGALALISLAADPAGWDSAFFLLFVPILPGAAFLAWRHRTAA